MKKLLHFEFLPRSADLALLILRLSFGLGLLWNHGWGKLLKFSTLQDSFPDPLGIGSTFSLIGALLGEVFFAAFLALGLYTRLSALVCGFTMGVAFFVVHGSALSGPNSGEMSFLFLSVFVALFIAGGGRFSLDRKLGAAS